MKTITFLFLSFLFLSFQDLTRIKKSDAANDGLVGKVKLVKEYEVQLNDSSDILKIIRSSYRIIKYEKDGRRIELEDYKNDTLVYRYIFPVPKLNSKGKQIEQNSSNSNGTWRTYIYDDNGNLIEINCFEGDGYFLDKIIYEYDKVGNRIEEIWYALDGSLEQKFVNKYDKIGNVIESTRIDSSRLLNRYTYKYDKKGNQIEWKNYDRADKLESTYNYQYSYNGNLVKIEQFDSLNILWWVKTYDYDEYGNIIFDTEIWHNIGFNNTYIKTYSYDYDKKGNWTKKIEFNAGIEDKPQFREIEYY